MAGPSKNLKTDSVELVLPVDADELVQPEDPEELEVEEVEMVDAEVQVNLIRIFNDEQIEEIRELVIHGMHLRNWSFEVVEAHLVQIIHDLYGPPNRFDHQLARAEIDEMFRQLREEHNGGRGNDREQQP